VILGQARQRELVEIHVAGEIVERMRQPVLFDGRNLYDPDDVREAGLEYHGVGRPGPARG
jgi:hypothetical protein